MTAAAEDAARRGDHRQRPRTARAPVMIPAQAHLDPRFKAFPNLPRGRVRVDPRRADPRPREARGRAERAHARAARVLGGRDRPARSRSPRRSRSRSSTPSSTRRRSGAWSGARGAGADLGGGLGVALPRGVARGDRQDDDGRASARPERRSCSRTAKIAWPEGRAGEHAVRMPLRWKRPADRRARRATATRRSPTRSGQLLALDRPPRGGRARARPRGDARRARPGDPPPRQEQPADGRVAAAAAGAGATSVDPRQGARRLGQPDPRDRGRARGADRAPRRRRRPRRAARAAAGDARAGARRATSGRGRRSSRSRWPGNRATALALVFSRAACRTRSSTAAARCAIELARSGTATSCSRSPTTARGIDGRRRTGTGLSIVRALVRDELGGTLSLGADGGLRAEVVFPA